METNLPSSTYKTTPSASRPRSYSGEYMQQGKEGERVVKEWLKTLPFVKSVLDVSDVEEKQRDEVDVEYELHDGRRLSGEIKTDNHLGVSGNFLVEVLRVNHTAPDEGAVTLGWFARSKAKYLFCYAPQVGKIYWGKFADLRRAFQEYAEKMRGKMTVSIVPTDAIKTTINFLVPLDVFGKVLKVEDRSTQP
jgi:hypothetical protein